MSINFFDLRIHHRFANSNDLATFSPFSWSIFFSHLPLFPLFHILTYFFFHSLPISYFISSFILFLLSFLSFFHIFPSFIFFSVFTISSPISAFLHNIFWDRFLTTALSPSFDIRILLAPNTYGENWYCKTCKNYCKRKKFLLWRNTIKIKCKLLYLYHNFDFYIFFDSCTRQDFTLIYI